MAGGGFADSYNEIRGGKWIEGESFDGHGAEMSASVYHLFNPGQLIPLNLVVRGAAHYSVYARDETGGQFPTARGRHDFQRPHRPALGRHRADAVSRARDGTGRVV